MKVTVTLQVSKQITVNGEDETDNFAPSKPTLAQIASAVHAAEKKCIDTAIELGFIQ